jgi:hypothetical protein
VYGGQNQYFPSHGRTWEEKDVTAVRDPDSAKRYLDSAVSGNIEHSICVADDDTPLRNLRSGDFSDILEKLAE